MSDCKYHYHAERVATQPVFVFVDEMHGPYGRPPTPHDHRLCQTVEPNVTELRRHQRCESDLAERDGAGPVEASNRATASGHFGVKSGLHSDDSHKKNSLFGTGFVPWSTWKSETCVFAGAQISSDDAMCRTKSTYVHH